MVSPKKAEQEYGGKGNGSQPKVPMMTSILLLFFGTDMHIQTHTCARTHMTQTHTCARTHMHMTQTHTCAYTHTHARTRTHTYTHTVTHTIPNSWVN